LKEVSVDPTETAIVEATTTIDEIATTVVEDVTTVPNTTTILTTVTVKNVNFDSDSFPIKSEIKLSGTVSKFQEPRNQGEFNIKKNLLNHVGLNHLVTNVVQMDAMQPFIS